MASGHSHMPGFVGGVLLRCGLLDKHRDRELPGVQGHFL